MARYRAVRDNPRDQMRTPTIAAYLAKGASANELSKRLPAGAADLVSSAPPVHTTSRWLRRDRGLLHLSPETASADVDAAPAAIKQHALAMHVGTKLTISFWSLTLPAAGVLVANIAPEACHLIANVAFARCHRSPLVFTGRPSGLHVLPYHVTGRSPRYRLSACHRSSRVTRANKPNARTGPAWRTR